MIKQGRDNFCKVKLAIFKTFQNLFYHKALLKLKNPKKLIFHPLIFPSYMLIHH